MNVPYVLAELENLKKQINDLEILKSFAFNNPNVFPSDVHEKISTTPFHAICRGQEALEKEKQRLEVALANTEVVLPE